MMIRELRVTDLHSLNKMYDSLSEESKRFFHPGCIGYKNINFLWLIFQIELLLSTIKILRKILLRVFPSAVFLPLVAIKQNKVVGFAYLKIEKRLNNRYFSATLGIGIDEAIRGKGLGSQLMENLLKLAQEENIKEISLTVLVDNEIALHLYKKHGFEKVGETVDRWKGKTFKALIMKKTL
jgi:ribosomal protein S18 acetylase RimI-like enzyme